MKAQGLTKAQVEAADKHCLGKGPKHTVLWKGRTPCPFCIVQSLEDEDG